MGENKLCPLTLGLTLGILWGGSILFVGVLNRFYEGYGFEFLQVVQSLYPGYEAQSGLRNLPIGVIWALVDGFVGGILLAWLYNLLGKRKSQ